MSASAPAAEKPPRLALTVSEAAASIGIGRAKMFQLVSSGQVASVKIGSARRVPVEAIRDFLNRSEAAVAAK